MITRKFSGVLFGLLTLCTATCTFGQGDSGTGVAKTLQAEGSVIATGAPYPREGIAGGEIKAYANDFDLTIPRPDGGMYSVRVKTNFAAPSVPPETLMLGAVYDVTTLTTSDDFSRLATARLYKMGAVSNLEIVATESRQVCIQGNCLDQQMPVVIEAYITIDTVY